MKKKPAVATLLILFLCMLNGTGQGQAISAGQGMVVSDNSIASDVGVTILRNGGNTVDAAVATAFALAVTHPQAGNIGGGGFMVIMDSTGFVTCIDFREKAPLKSSPDMYLDNEGNLVEAKDPFGDITTVNHAGIRSVGVPGSVAGLYLAHSKYGSMPWERLLQPAIDLAESGFKMTPTLANHAAYFDSTAQVSFLEELFTDSNGTPLQAGDVWCQPELAATLEKIRDHGHDGFYSGRNARKLVRYMTEEGGLITKKDLKNYRAIERVPVKGTYRGCEVWSMPLPSSGGITLVEMLNMTEAALTAGVVCADTLALEHAYTQTNTAVPVFGSTAYVHLMAEIMRRAYADRARYLGDPDFEPGIPLDLILSKRYAGELVATIDPRRASISDSSRFNQLPEGTNTTHVSVLDRSGNAVSLTTTLEHSYGSGLGVPGLGYLLNNEMGDFNPVPGLTNNRGLIGTEPNSIEPGKRMLSSMTPSIVTKDGIPILIIGSPGGRTIINTVFQTILNVIEYKMPVDQAIEALKIHHQWLPDRILYEKELMPEELAHALEQMGHHMVPVQNLGRLMGITFDPHTGTIRGYADSSSPDGGAKGY